MMLTFDLFRIKVYERDQGNLWRGTHENRCEYLRDAILSEPSIKLRGGTLSHIGDIEQIDEYSLYFRFGKTISTKVPHFGSGHFYDVPFDKTPYTHVILDWCLELCAIAKQSQLAPTTSAISKMLFKVMNKSGYAVEKDIQFEIAQVSDPNDFITVLNNAYAVNSFSMTLSRPNIFDVNEDFQKPLQSALEKIYADSGKVELKSEKDLNREALTDIAQSAAATGEKARAKLRITKDSKPKVVKLFDNPSEITIDSIDSKELKQNFVERLRSLLERVRHGRLRKRELGHDKVEGKEEN